MYYTDILIETNYLILKEVYRMITKIVGVAIVAIVAVVGGVIVRKKQK